MSDNSVSNQLLNNAQQSLSNANQVTINDGCKACGAQQCSNYAACQCCGKCRNCGHAHFYGYQQVYPFVQPHYPTITWYSTLGDKAY